jgi:hypothetical protein
MNNRQHSQPRQIDGPDDDLPNAPPWPWQVESSGQASRAEHQQLADLGEHHGRH